MNRKPFYKTVWFWAVSIVIYVAIIVAVSKTNVESPVFLLSETAVISDLKITATEIEMSMGDDYFKPACGNVFVGVYFTFENISDEEKTIDFSFFDIFVDGVKCEVSTDAMAMYDDANVIIVENVSAGNKLKGWYAVEIPANWRELEFEIQIYPTPTFVFNK